MELEDLIVELHRERQRTEEHLASLTQVITAFDRWNTGAKGPVKAETPDLEHCYELRIGVAYRFIRRGQTVRTGEGHTVNLSSRMILMATDNILPIGVPIEVLMAWPARINDLVPMSLYIQGRTLYAEGNQTSVEIHRHEFRTRRRETGNAAFS